MKININAKELTNALKYLNWPGKPLDIILENALLVVDDGSIRVSRNAFDIYVTINLKGEIQEPGSCLVPVKNSLSILKNCEGEILLEFDGDNLLKIGPYTLNILPQAEEYPGQPDGHFEVIGTVHGHVLAQAIKKTTPWLYKRNDGFPSSSENFCLESGKLITTNTHCLFQAELGLEYDQQLIIDDSLKLLEKINFEGEIKIAKSEEFLSLKGNNFEAFVRLVDGTYPRWQDVAPTKGYPLKIDANALIKGLKETIDYVRATTKEKKHIPVFLLWLKDRVEICAEFNGKGIRKTIAENDIPFPLSMPLNAVYLLTAIKDAKGELIIWHPGDMRQPFVITDGKTYKYLQAPIKLEQCGNHECQQCLTRPEHCHPFPEGVPLQEIPYSPDLTAIPEPTRKKVGSRKRTKKAAKPSKKASSGQEKALAELRERLNFWENEALRYQKQVNNLLEELEKLQESYKTLMQIQALRPNGKGRYAFINGQQFLFSQGKVFDEDRNVVGYYDQKGNGALKGQSFKIQREYVIALN